MSAMEAYLSAAGAAVALLRRPEVGAAWEQDSVLAEMTVASLAGHLAYQIFSVGPTLEEPAAEDEAPIPLLEHYARAAWIDAPLDGEVNAGIRASGERIAAEGAPVLARRADAAYTELTTRLDGRPGDSAVFLSRTGWALTLDDFLTTRTMELAVHMDDLAVSVKVAPPELPEAAFAPVLDLLARLAVRRHGQSALLRALTRAERAPVAVNAF